MRFTFFSFLNLFSGFLYTFTNIYVVNLGLFFQTFQPVLYEAASFENATEKLRSFTESLDRPFHVRYSPLTQTMEVDRNIKSMMCVAL